MSFDKPRSKLLGTSFPSLVVKTKQLQSVLQVWSKETSNPTTDYNLYTIHNTLTAKSPVFILDDTMYCSRNIIG